MVALPLIPLGTGEVAIGGTPVTFRSLSRAEVVALAGMGDDKDAAEVFILSRACGITEDEARDWRTKTDAPTVDELLKPIAVLSGLRASQGNR